MNKIVIKNSYFTQKVNILINDEEISQYSKLSSILGVNLYSYVSNVTSLLDSEVFDDYEIDFYGYKFIYDLICRYAEKSEYCKGINYYMMEMIDTPENVMEMLHEMAQEHNLQLKKNLGFTLYMGRFEIEIEDKEYIKKIDSLPSDVGIFGEADEVKSRECKFYIKIGTETVMFEENLITIPRECVEEVLEYYYIHNLYIPNFEEYITALKYQNLSNGESILLNAVQNNVAKYYLGSIPSSVDLSDEIQIDFASFPSNAYRIAISDEGKLKQDKGKWRAVSAGQVIVTVFDTDNNSCESHKLNIIEHKYATNIKIIPQFEYLKVNERNYVDVIVEPENAEDKDELLYEVSDSNIIKYENGQIIALKDGNTTLTVKGKTCKGTLNIQVKSPINQVILNQTSITMRSGTTTIIQCSVLPQNAETQHIVWELDNKNIAAINPSRDKMKCQISASESFTGKGNIRCYDQNTGVGGICNFEVVSKIKHTWIGTVALLCMLFGFFLPVLSVASIGLGIYGLVKDEEASHNTRYIVCAVISLFTIGMWIGSM